MHGGSLLFTSSGRKIAKLGTGATPIENFGGLKRRGGRKTAERLLVGLRESHVESRREAKVPLGLRRKGRRFRTVVARRDSEEWRSAWKQIVIVR